MHEKGFILDGFPRTVPQAQALEDALAEVSQPLSAVLKFAISDDMAVLRLSNRWTCPTCKRTYNMEFKPPANDRLCDLDDSALERRADDDELTVRRRLAVYQEQTAPLEAFYATEACCSRSTPRRARTRSPRGRCRPWGVGP